MYLMEMFAGIWSEEGWEAISTKCGEGKRTDLINHSVIVSIHQGDPKKICNDVLGGTICCASLGEAEDYLRPVDVTFFAIGLFL
jgi:hypothetical protein